MTPIATRARLGPESAMTLNPSHRVAIFLEHGTAADRLQEFVPDLLERDRRIEVLYVLPRSSSRFSEAMERYASTFDGKVVSWEWATDPERRFALVVAANTGYDSNLEQLRGPLLTVSHGIGPGKLHMPGPGNGPGLLSPPVADVVPSTLVRHGRVTASAIGVGSENHGRLLVEAVPETQEVVRLVGDPAFDRAEAAEPRRRELRRSIGVGGGQTLVVLSSTWGPASLFGFSPEVLDRAVGELPADHMVVTLLHPGIWARYSPRQIRFWFGRALSCGLRILAPDSPWSGLLAASDVVVGDVGSTTAYGAALGAAPLLGGGVGGEVASGTAVDSLCRTAPRYRPDEPFAPQVASALFRYGAEAKAHYRRRVTTVPGESAVRLRALMYGLMGLPEPVFPAFLSPVEEPFFLGGGRAGRWSL
ncbi:hypothetical protein GCM10007147_33770 [Nocardiopsis kunsanensis]|uniref:Uncharacterized protein n=1 Tax=Nocardiopsis kunsanensis TaxID=141693 RepID=A0A918XGN4_9ACTN|nr:hypothetical protein [Nocardiopsis kunsanensis]GHD31165.1 hypothetical protein GCM10007147_33770 [Nocardiopsis kunsanensis]